MNPNYAARVKEEIDKLLNARFIPPAKQAMQLSPIVVVLKKNGKIHIVAVFRAYVVVKKTVQGWNWGTKAWEPALHARARQVVHRGELGG